MHDTIAYSKPNIVFLGRVMEVIRYTGVKRQPGVMETVQWYMNPAYDLDE